MTEDQLHTTTKRTIMENEQMTTELQYQSKETERYSWFPRSMRVRVDVVCGTRDTICGCFRIARSNAKLEKENRVLLLF